MLRDECIHRVRFGRHRGRGLSPSRRFASVDRRHDRDRPGPRRPGGRSVHRQRGDRDGRGHRRSQPGDGVRHLPQRRATGPGGRPHRGHAHGRASRIVGQGGGIRTVRPRGRQPALLGQGLGRGADGRDEIRPLRRWRTARQERRLRLLAAHPRVDEGHRLGRGHPAARRPVPQRRTSDAPKSSRKRIKVSRE